MSEASTNRVKIYEPSPYLDTDLVVQLRRGPCGGKRGMKRSAAFKAPVRKPKVAVRKPPMKRAKSMTTPKSIAPPAKPALKRFNSMASIKPAAAPAPAKPGLKRANSMPAVKLAPHSYIASNTQFKNISSQKIGEKGKPNGPERPIVYSNPQNRFGQQKIYYRGVKALMASPEVATDMQMTFSKMV
jgi:hypothetical protein